MSMVAQGTITALGGVVSKPIAGFGRYILFAWEILRRTVQPPLTLGLLIRQLEFVGNRSILIICMAGCLIGAVYGLQLGKIFGLFGAESMLGAAAAYSMCRELAPVVGAFIVTGRAGSSMAAEIATMRVNEQIDAMRVMAVNPINFLVAPRVVASMIMMPLLTAVFIACGILTSYVMGISIYQVDPGLFFGKITDIVRAEHVIEGFEKAAFFGFLFASISCYKGYTASGGAKGVGRATTEAVVVSLVTILIGDFVFSYLQFEG